MCWEGQMMRERGGVSRREEGAPEPQLTEPLTIEFDSQDRGASPSDARLVERARLGDDDSFGMMVTRYERKLVRVLTRIVQDEHLARDLAQETFWKVYTRLDRFDTSRRFGPWLFQVGVNIALDHLRRVGSVTTSLDTAIEGRRGIEPCAPDGRPTAELAQEVQFVLKRIPVDYRTVLILRDLEGFSTAEVASIVRRREPTIRWRLSRAREIFREHWERRHPAHRHSSPAPASANGEKEAWDEA
jgi:RNA polymerase sigma-70 factor (ECF subfamily)